MDFLVAYIEALLVFSPYCQWRPSDSSIMIVVIADARD
jgi:hypothetical protein